MARKSTGEPPLPRVSIGLSEGTWQEIAEIAKDEVRAKAVQASYFVQLGLIAHKNGYRIKNGGLKRLEQVSKAS